MTSFTRTLLTSLMACALVPSAQAHVSFAQPEAVAGSYTKLVLQVPHGCGASATKAVTVHVPPGFLIARPMVKPGWTVSLTKAVLKPPLQLHGKPLDETTASIRWEGGPLPSEYYDEFALFGKLSDQAAGSLVFRVTQTCEQGELDWNGAAGSATPAPVLRVLPAPPVQSASAPGHQH